MFRIILCSMVLWIPISSWGQEADFTVFEVRRQLAMSNAEKTHKDYYIHAGSENGIKEGQVYDVLRKVPLYDSFRNRSVGELSIKVAKLQVIFTDKNVSVARFHQDFSRQNLPVLDDNFILLGDRLDPNSAGKMAHDQDQEPQKPETVAIAPVQVVINSVDVSAQVLGE